MELGEGMDNPTSALADEQVPVATEKRRKSARGIRSRASRAMRTANFIASPLHAHKLSLAEDRHSEQTSSQYPTEFRGGITDQKQVRRIVRKKYPGKPAILPPLSHDYSILMPTPPGGNVSEQHPPYLFMRFDHGLNTQLRDRLLKAWGEFEQTQPVHSKKNDSNRSKTPAFHLGTWELYKSKPVITSESRKQTPAALAAMDKLLLLVADFVVPKIKALLQRYAPKQWDRQQRAYSRLKSIEYLAHIYVERPALDFSGAFFTIAVKAGSSEIIHLDVNDDKMTLTWVFAVGDWEGGEFCAPQLGLRIPIRPGQLFAVMAGVVAHCSAPVTNGYRLIFTCFSDKFLMSHSDAMVIG